MAHRIERAAVELKKCVRALSCQHYRFEVEVGGCSVARMRDDVDAWILNGANQGRGVLLAVAIGIAEQVQARDDVVHAVKRVRVCDVHVALIVNNVQFRSQQQAHVAILAWHHMEVAEIDIGAGAWDGRPVLGYTKQCQFVLLCLSYHFVEGAERVA